MSSLLENWIPKAKVSLRLESSPPAVNGSASGCGASATVTFLVCLDTEFSSESETAFGASDSGQSGSAADPFARAKSFVREAVGTPKAKTAFYAGRDLGSSTWLCVVPASSTRRIGGHAIGAKGHATVQGASACAALLSLPPGALGAGSAGDAAVRLSPALKAAVGTHGEEFLTGFLHRGVSLKVAFGAREGADGKPSATLHAFVSRVDFSPESFAAAQSLNEAMVLARGLVNMPANVLNPESYEILVREVLKRETQREGNSGQLAVEAFGVDALVEKRCGLVLAVGKGSDIAPRILKLTYTPSPSAPGSRHVTLVGKGITFDTGGLDIKASNFMRNMKKDMGGSAAALGAFLALARRKVPARVTCYLALAENMVSGRAMRPGDVYTARNGLTVEIDNTDAEGRLVLADALCLAAEESPDWIIDLATLTGAARTALGGGVDALFSNDKAREDLIFRTGLELGDPVWPLPLVDDYEPLLDSGVADVVNSASSPQGGAITAGLFLRKFVGQVPWSHVDTYMWTDRAGELFAEPGATAKCVRLVEAAVRSFAQG